MLDNLYLHGNKRSISQKRKPQMANKTNKKKPLSGSRIQDGALLAGSTAADLSVRYQHCP